MERLWKSNLQIRRAWLTLVAALSSAGLLGCTVDGSFLKANQEDLTEVPVIPNIQQVAIAPPSVGTEWNLLVDGEDSVCDPAVDTDCENAGEQRQVELDGVSSCDNLTIEEDLGLFEWSCEVINGKATFSTSGLKAGKGLKDILSASGWKANKVTVYSGNYLAFESNSEPWWTNEVETLPDNSSGDVIVINGTDDDGDGPDKAYSDGAIFVVDSDKETSGYIFDIDNAALVVLDGATLSYSGNSSNNCNASTGEATSPDAICLIAVANQNAFWLEGDLDGAGTPSSVDHGVLLNTVKFAKLLNVSLSNTGTGHGISLANSTSNSFYNVAISKAAQSGLALNGSTQNIFNKIFVSENGQHGLLLENSADKNSLTTVNASNNTQHGVYVDSSHENKAHNVTFSNNGKAGAYFNTAEDNTWTHVVANNNVEQGVKIFNSFYNTFTNLTTVNNALDGVMFSDTSDYNTLVHLVSSNNGDKGFHFKASDENRFAQLVLTENKNYGLYFIGSGSYNNSFKHNNIFGGNGSDPVTNDCHWAGATSGNDILADCSASGAATNINILRSSSTADSFVGKLDSEDSANESDSLGVQSYASITDWFNFDNLFRGWGKQGSAFPSNDQQGSCTSGTCQIWDLSLVSGASNSILNKVGDGVSDISFTDGGACPAEVGGTVVLEDVQTVANTFLVNATEIVSDSVGDNDGLCESNEACFFNPNFGAYQGSGNVKGSSCTFSDGDIAGVQMYAYDTNGEN